MVYCTPLVLFVVSILSLWSKKINSCHASFMTPVRAALSFEMRTETICFNVCCVAQELRKSIRLFTLGLESPHTRPAQMDSTDGVDSTYQSAATLSFPDIRPNMDPYKV